MKCFLCFKGFEDAKIFRAHLRHHGIQKKTPVYCIDGNCAKKEPKSTSKFSNISNLVRHYNDVHGLSSAVAPVPPPAGPPLLSPPPSPHSPLSPTSPIFVPELASADNTEIVPVNEGSTEEEESNAKSLRKAVDLYVANLCSNQRNTRSQIQDNVDFTRVLLYEFSSVLKPFCLKLASECVGNTEVRSKEVKQLFDELQHCFDPIRSEYMRKQTYSKEGSLILPQSLSIGTADGVSTGSKPNSAETISLTVEFIPLRVTLKKFLEMPGTMSKIIAFKKKVEGEERVLSNFMNGAYWKSFNTNGKFYLGLFGYSDDFETGNSCGPAKGNQKLTGVYVSMPFLPPEVYTNLKNILVTYLYMSENRKSVSNADLYEYIIDEFKFLDEEGILIETPEYWGKVYFTLGLMLGDNLGIHEILGFTSCFTANFPCRYCLIPRLKMYFAVIDDWSLWRTRSSYDKHIEMNNLSKTGIKELCVWHRLKYFHCTTHAALDLMHDLAEGCCKSAFKVILNYYIKNGILDLDTVNERIQMFSYGSIDSSSRPPIIKWEKSSVKISMSAAQMLIFTKYFGLIIGDLVEKEHPVWELYVTLRQILDIVLSPSICKEHLTLLSTLIEEHLKLYIRLSPNHRLKNKHHHLLHYPHLIAQFGPPIYYWCMRLEAKHQILKSIAVSISSSLSLAASVAFRYQLAFHSYLRQESFITQKVKCGSSFSCRVSEIVDYVSFADQVPEDIELVEEVSSVDIFGTTFKNHMVLVTGFVNELPVFGFIKKILVIDPERVAFVCLPLKTLHFDTHYQCFEVESTKNVSQFIQFSDLGHTFPTVINRSNSGNLYITYKYGL